MTRGGPSGSQFALPLARRQNMPEVAAEPTCLTGAAAGGRGRWRWRWRATCHVTSWAALQNIDRYRFGAGGTAESAVADEAAEAARAETGTGGGDGGGDGSDGGAAKAAPRTSKHFPGLDPGMVVAT